MLTGAGLRNLELGQNKKPHRKTDGALLQAGRTDNLFLIEVYSTVVLFVFFFATVFATILVDFMKRTIEESLLNHFLSYNRFGHLTLLFNRDLKFLI